MSVTEELCPNCGAPLSLIDGRCEFCEAPLVVGADGTAGAARSPTPPAETAFSMPVSTVASIKLRGTLVTGRVATGTAAGGMKVILTHKGENTLLTCVEVDPSTDDPASVGAGQVVGLYLQDQAGNDLNHRHVKEGDWLHAPGVAAPG